MTASWTFRKGSAFSRLRPGYQYSCGIRADGGVTCWGRNDHAQLDAPDGQFTAIDAGWDHVCALSGTDAICWGWNANERATPPPGLALTAIGAGAEHSCGLTPNGDLEMLGEGMTMGGRIRAKDLLARWRSASRTHVR